MKVVARGLAAAPNDSRAAGCFFLLSAFAALAFASPAPAQPVKDLSLPADSMAAAPYEPVVTDDLADVPEVALFDMPEKGATKEQVKTHLQKLVRSIDTLNKTKTDGFLLALMGGRAELRGLPFLLGNDCRQPALQADLFREAVLSIRGKLGTASSDLFQTTPQAAAKFWRELASSQIVGIKGPKSKMLPVPEHAAAVDVLMQVVGPDTPAMRRGLVQYLASVPDVKATEALARLAIFSAEADIRDAAIAALKVRNERDYTHVLLRGLSYPWPEVARNSALAIAATERNDLAATLVNVLDEPDPRLPQVQTIGGKSVYVARQLVRLNHNRNCLLCHATASDGGQGVGVLVAPVSLAGESLPPISKYYGWKQGDIAVRADVTYLRQDFSRVQEVANAKPWPRWQRFDFVVRSVTMNRDQAQAYQTRFYDQTAGQPSPYRLAAVQALRELTGLDVGPTAAEWRKALKLPD